MFKNLHCFGVSGLSPSSESVILLFFITLNSFFVLDLRNSCIIITLIGMTVKLLITVTIRTADDISIGPTLKINSGTATLSMSQYVGQT